MLIPRDHGVPQQFAAHVHERRQPRRGRGHNAALEAVDPRCHGKRIEFLEAVGTAEAKRFVLAFRRKGFRPVDAPVHRELQCR
jgi:hypothetical protein